MSKKFNTRTIVSASLLIALQIILVRFLQIGNEYVRISLGFLPVAVAGMIFGPVGGGVVAAIADIFGMVIFSRGMPYFFPLTICEALYGVGFGLILHGKNLSAFKRSFFTGIQFIFINLILTSVALYFYFIFITGSPRGVLVILSGRLITALVNLPMHIIGINIISRYLREPLYKMGWGR